MGRPVIFLGVALAVIELSPRWHAGAAEVQSAAASYAGNWTGGGQGCPGYAVIFQGSVTGEELRGSATSARGWHAELNAKIGKDGRVHGTITLSSRSLPLSGQLANGTGTLTYVPNCGVVRGDQTVNLSITRN
jgi:hypothetical protein